MPELPSIADIRAAAMRIAGKAVVTPLLRCDSLDEATGARVFVKAECLQRTGSFKFRGAYNAISSLDEAARARGVVACSSGNHAQGVAEAARLFGIGATIVMPSDAPAIKIARTRRSGANVVLYDRATQDRDAIAAEIVRQTGAAFIHPYDNFHVIAGQGTAGLEAAAQLQALGLTGERVLVCTGGGGLTAGVALAMADAFPGIAIHGCEPDGFDDYGRSLQAGERLSNDRLAGSVCDAILTPSPGEISFAINARLGASGLAASDAEALGAMRFAFEELKIVLEPGGAISLACLLKQDKAFAGETLVVVASGGNVDPAIFARAIA